MERKSGTGSSAGNSWQTVCQMAIKNDYMWFVCVCKCVTSADVCCGMWECVDKVYNVKSSESCNCWEFIIKLETRLWIDYAGAKLWGIKKLEKVTFRHVFLLSVFVPWTCQFLLQIMAQTVRRSWKLLKALRMAKLCCWSCFCSWRWRFLLQFTY